MCTCSFVSSHTSLGNIIFVGKRAVFLGFFQWVGKTHGKNVLEKKKALDRFFPPGQEICPCGQRCIAPAVMSQPRSVNQRSRFNLQLIPSCDQFIVQHHVALLFKIQHNRKKCLYKISLKKTCPSGPRKKMEKTQFGWGKGRKKTQFGWGKSRKKHGKNSRFWTGQSGGKKTRKKQVLDRSIPPSWKNTCFAAVPVQNSDY